ncbi:MAG: HD domain-containing protein [Planctomycetes bacterium]|nr:HD domain-containing protein [Planctomycetota bacterium]
MDTNPNIKEKLIAEMKAIFAGDEKRINHALAVLDRAETINKSHGADELIVSATAILHDIGIQEAERVHGSNAGKYQEIEGPPIAEKILKKLNLPGETIDRVCKIIANHHSAKDKPTAETKEFEVIWDADWLINFCEIYTGIDPAKKAELIECIFKTQKGRQLAKNTL